MPDPTPPPTNTEDLEAALRAITLPPFEISETTLSSTKNGQDAEIGLSWSGQMQRFLVEYRTTGTPKQIAEGARQVVGLAAKTPGARPMLIAPFLSAPQIEELLAQGISAVDLSGNFGIVVPKRWLVMRTGSKNLFPSSAPIKNVYRGVSSLVPRALLTRGSFRSSTAILRDIEATVRITPPTISKVLRSLREDLLVAQDGDVRVLQPEGILDKLGTNYQAPIRNRLRAKLALDDTTKNIISANAVATGTLYAVDATDMYTIMPSSSGVARIYTTSISSLTAALTLDTSSRFPNVEFVEISDVAPFYGRQLIDGLYRTSRLQVYLELQAGGSRERQTAEQLRTALLAPSVATPS